MRPAAKGLQTSDAAVFEFRDGCPWRDPLRFAATRQECPLADSGKSSSGTRCHACKTEPAPSGSDNQTVMGRGVMKKYIVICTLSAMLGGLASTLVTRPAIEPRLAAQDVSASPLRRDIEDGLTPAERVSIAVYERVNRSVVNITTVLERQDMFFMLEPPSEGAGSGSVLDQEGNVLTNFHVIEGDSRSASPCTTATRSTLAWSGRIRSTISPCCGSVRLANCCRPSNLPTRPS